MSGTDNDSRGNDNNYNHNNNNNDNNQMSAPVMLSNEQFTSLIQGLASSNSTGTRSKLDKIRQLNELTRSSIEDFLYDYNRKRKSDDRIVNFVGRDVYEYLKDKTEETNSTLADANVQLILKELLDSLDGSMQYGSGRDYAKQLSWPVSGTTEERLTKFLQLCKRVERRITDIDNVFVRHEFNKAICRVLPSKFGLKESMIHHDKFQKLTGLEEFLKERSWAVKLDTEDDKKVIRINKVSEEPPNHTLLDQALDVIKEKATLEINQLKTEIQELKAKQFQNDNNTQNNQNNQLLPLMLEMMRIQNPRPTYTPSAVPPYTQPTQQFVYPSQRPRPFQQQTVSNYSTPRLNLQPQSRKPARIIALLKHYNLPSTARLYELGRTGKSIECVFTVFDKTAGRKVNISGHLDSGAFTTAGSLQKHAQYCKELKNVPNEVYLVLPEQTCIQAKTCGVMDVDVTNKEGQVQIFQNVLVFLVDHPGWSELLIGRPTLRAHNLLPEQHFNNNNRNTPQITNGQNNSNLFNRPGDNIAPLNKTFLPRGSPQNN
ncbi:MAG: hypothetical protein DHS20C13_29230 [Thermodesulfobacteriota bacterium]|nr:MAG: hypothetical protein DHS20C13_29230 [Thermodesulfobacteriota bacterium]